MPGSSLTNDNDLIVDALFGFSFTGEIRSPFDQVIQVYIYSREVKVEMWLDFKLILI